MGIGIHENLFKQNETKIPEIRLKKCCCCRERVSDFQNKKQLVDNVIYTTVLYEK